MSKQGQEGDAGFVGRLRPGRLLRRWALQTQEYFALLFRALHGTVTRPFYWDDFFQQMDSIGVSSLGIVVLTGLFMGMVLALQSSVEMERFGATIYIGRLVGASVVREMGPVLTALMVTARAGSGIAAQLGAMRVTEQINALQSMGVDPVRRLVTPRLLAGLVMMPVLTVVADAVGILGGLLIAVTKLDLTPSLYFQGVWATLAQTGFVLRFVPVDVLMGLVKPVAFGGLMAMTSCFYGMRASGGTEGVGEAATRAVVTSAILVVGADYFLTQLLIEVLVR